MKNILEELYYGNLCPCDRPCAPGSEEKELLRKLCCAESLLNECLPKEKQSAFSEYQHTQQMLHEVSASASFASGFRLGVHLMLAVFEYDKERISE